MDENLELDLDPINRTQERIVSLSDKVKTTSQERDAANAAKDAAETGRIAAEKERDFYASFSDSAVKYPGASEYKDRIKEKVLAGYSVEDATVSVLNSEGKLSPQAPAVVAPPPAAGGSAVVNLPSDGVIKPVGEMSREDKRNALMEAEKRGDLALS